MKISVTVGIILASLALAGCTSNGGYDARYDASYPSTAEFMGKNVGKVVPNASLNSKVREAERKSIGNDLPYAVVR